MSGDNKSEEDYENYDRRRQLYHAAFEDYDSIKMTYYKFYTASDAMKRRGRVLTYGSTLFAAILLLIIGNIVVRGGPEWGTDLAFAVSVIVGTLSFFNAVDRPKRKSNILYKSGQQLQRVYQEYHYFVTVRLPDPDEDLQELENEYQKLRERKNIVNEATPQLGGKWYRRVKESRVDWEPKPLYEVTGKDGEFEIDGGNKSTDDSVGYSRKVIRWIGF